MRKQIYQDKDNLLAEQSKRQSQYNSYRNTFDKVFKMALTNHNVKDINFISIYQLIIHQWYSSLQLTNPKNLEQIMYEIYLHQQEKIDRKSEQSNYQAFIELTALKYIIDKIICQQWKFRPQIITRSQSMKKLIRKYLQYDKSLYDKLIYIVLKSKTHKIIQMSAAAAITILNIAKFKFSGMDLSGISIPYADLSSGHFQNTNLQDCNLQNTNFYKSYCISTKFNRSVMTGIKFDHSVIQFYENINYVDFDASGKYFACCFVSKVVIFEINNLKRINTINRQVERIKIYPSVNLVICSSRQTYIDIFDFQNLQLINRINNSLTKNRIDIFSLSVLSFDQTNIICADSGGFIKIFNKDTTTQINRIQAYEDKSFTLCCSNDKIYTLRDYDKIIKIWNYTLGTLIGILQGHINSIKSLSCSSDGNRLLTCSLDAINVWDVSKQQIILTLIDVNMIRVACYSGDQKMIISGSFNQPIKFWDSQTGTKVYIANHNKNKILNIYSSPSGRYIISSSHDRSIKIWNLQLINSQKLADTQDFIYSMNYSPDGKSIVTGHNNKLIKLWNAQNGSELKILRGHKTSVTCVTYSLDGKYILSGCKNGIIQIWDAQTEKNILTITGHHYRISSIDCSSKSNRLASSSWDNTIKIWKLSTGHNLRTLIGHQDLISSINFSADGSKIVSGSWDSKIRIWNVQTGSTLKIFQYAIGFIYSVRYSPDGRNIISSGSDATVKIWDVLTGQNIKTLYGHKDYVSSVSYSPDGLKIASASFDKTAKIWDAQTGISIATIKGDGRISSVCFSPNGKRIACSNYDKTGKILSVFTFQSLSELRKSQVLDSQNNITVQNLNQLKIKQFRMVFRIPDSLLVKDLEMEDVVIEDVTYERLKQLNL